VLTILLVLTVIFWGIAPIFDKIALSNSSPFLGNLSRSITITFVLLAITFLGGKTKEFLQIDFRSFIYFALSGIFAGCLGVFTYYKALQISQTSKIVPLAATYPLVTALLSVIFLREQLTFSRILGTLLIIVGIWLVK
jgi:transporter family protein